VQYSNGMKPLLLSLFLASSLAAGPKIVLVGDSTVNNQGGWGPGFRASFSPDVEILNLALNGRSSKSFRDEGAWAPALAAKPDYILIQFGHNDVPGKGADRETDAKTTYRANLNRYIDEARAIGATPILVTSIVRRVFTPEGKFRPDSLVPYVEAVHAVAAERKVPLMDLYQRTREQAEQLGPVGCLSIHAVTAEGKPDTTHLGPLGRHTVGLLAAAEFVRVAPVMKAHLVPGIPSLQVVVSPDGKGDFKTIQMAVDHAPFVQDGQRLIVEIRPGTYHERVIVPQDRPRTTFLGSDARSTVITAAMSAKEAGGTFLSSTVDIEAAAFHAENITFENTFGPGNGNGSQAVAIKVHSDQAEFRHCRFLGWQDTLYAATGRQHYLDSYIAGHVDFIFGNATAVFENTEIHSLGDGYITAHSRTAPELTTGFVFLRCHLTGENTQKGVYLGRPWRPYSRVVFLDCEMDAHIRPEGWENWRDPNNEKTAWYAEAGSQGPGARVSGRVPWSRQLTPAEAEQFRPAAFLK